MQDLLRSIESVIASLHVSQEETKAEDGSAIVASVRNVSDLATAHASRTVPRGDNETSVLTVSAAVVDAADAAPAPKRREPLLLSLLRRRYDENLYSDLLATLLTPHVSGELAYAIFDRLFQHITGCQPVAAPPRELQVVTREARLDSIDLGLANRETGSRRIDIIAQSGTRVLVIENKVWTKESANQTQDYLGAVRRRFPDCAYSCTFALLSPDGRVGQARAFRGLSYEGLHGVLQEVALAGEWPGHGRDLLNLFLAEVWEAFVLPRAEALVRTAALLRGSGYNV